MYEWLEGLQKSAKRTADGVGPEDVRRAETECGVPFPEELSTLFQRFNGGEFQGEVTLFALHGPAGEPSVMEKTRLKLEGLPAAGIWRIGVKAPHRQLFSARKSALREQADAPLPGWAEPLSDDHWLYGTWETEKRELRLYRSLEAMLEVLVPPAEVEEFGDRTFANALSAVQGKLSDLSVEYEEEGVRPGDQEAAEDEEQDEEQDEEAAEDEEEAAGEETDGEARSEAAEDEATEDEATEDEATEDEATEDEATEDEDEDEAAEDEAAEDEEEGLASEEDASDEELRQPVVAAAQRRVQKIQRASADEGGSPAATPRGSAKKAAPRASPASSARKGAAKAPAKKAATKKAPARKGPPAKKTPARKAATKKAPAKKAPAKKAATKKAPARKAPARKGLAKKAPAKKAATKKAPARKAPARKAATKRGATRGRR